jgi:hypothetical protein
MRYLAWTSSFRKGLAYSLENRLRPVPAADKLLSDVFALVEKVAEKTEPQVPLQRSSQIVPAET